MKSLNPLLCSFIDDNAVASSTHNCYVCNWRDRQMLQFQMKKSQIAKFMHSLATRIQNLRRWYCALLFISLYLGAEFCVQGHKVVEAEVEDNVRGDFWFKSHRVLIISMVISAVCVVLTVNTVKAYTFASDFPEDELASIRDKIISSRNDANTEEREVNYGRILSLSIRCKTVSYDDRGLNQKRNEELLKMHKILEENFPLIHKLYPPIKINNFSLLFEIPGQCKDKKPIMLCSHLDVVPAENSNEWIHDPFSGHVVDGFVWGRGSIDNKHNVVSQLGAVEELLKEKQKPKRTILLAIGHDEEIGGYDGAKYIASYLKERNHTIDFILDEGTMMASGAIPGTKTNIALIGITEKGSMNLELSVQGSGGHSSLPPIHEENPIKIISKAIVALESKPHSSHFNLGSPFRISLEYISGKLRFPFNVFFGNIWLFKKLLMILLIRSSSGVAASMRTTTAVTKIEGGEKINALPSNVKAFVNHRVHPLDTFDRVIDSDIKAISDNRVHVRVLDSFPAAPITDYRSSSFKYISKCVKAVFGFDSTPSLMVGNTDTRWYWNLSENIYRFSPIPLTLQETKMFHGVNEKISVKDLTNMVDFYKILISSAE